MPEVMMGQILQAVGLGGLLVIALAFGWLRTKREVTDIITFYQEAAHTASEAHRQALDAERRNTDTERAEKEYWRDTSLRLLEVGERIVADGQE